jgi:hypothetical protein
MNIAFRRREMSRINAENEKFVKVLKSVKTTMPRTEWQSHIKYQKELKKIRGHARFKSQPRAAQKLGGSQIVLPEIENTESAQEQSTV